MTVLRTDPPLIGAERSTLEAYLEYQRATLLVKCEGLADDQLRIASAPPSPISLLGLVRHLTEVERNWFQRVLEGRPIEGLYYTDADPDGEFTGAVHGDVVTDMATFQRTCDESRAIAAAHGLDDTGTRRGELVSLRWIFLHMIEEYARHNGHADLVRERIDGATGE